MDPEHYGTAFAIVMAEMSGMPLSAADLDKMRAEFARPGATDQKEMLESMRKLLSEAEGLPADRIRRIDALLAKQGLPRLSEFTADDGSDDQPVILSVLARGSIATEEECRAVEDELDDMTSDLTDDQRVKLGEMINRFYER